MRSALHRSSTGCFLCAYSYESTHIESGDPAHVLVFSLHCCLLFSKEKHLLCLPMTLQLSQPTSQLLQHRAKCGTAEHKWLLHWSQHLTPGAEEGNSVSRGSHSHSHIGQWPAWGGQVAGFGQHTAKCYLLEVRPPCPEQCLGWIWIEGCKYHHTAKLPLRDTNQPRALQCQHHHAKTETGSSILRLPESIIFFRQILWEHFHCRQWVFLLRGGHSWVTDYFMSSLEIVLKFLSKSYFRHLLPSQLAVIT